MRCRCLSSWNRSTQHVARQPCLRLRSHIFKVVLVLAALLALQYAFSTIFETRQLEPLFTVNFTHSRGHSHWSFSSHSRGLLFPNHSATVNGSMHAPIEKVSGDQNISVEIKNTSVLPVHESFIGNTSSLNNVSLSSDINQTAVPTVTVPVTGKVLCPPIPPNLSKSFYLIEVLLNSNFLIRIL